MSLKAEGFEVTYAYNGYVQRVPNIRNKILLCQENAEWYYNNSPTEQTLPNLY